MLLNTRIIQTHCLISLQEIVDYEVLLEGNPFDVSGVDLLPINYRKNLEFLVELAYEWYGDEAVEQYKNSCINPKVLLNNKLLGLI